jgi:hypothetical protein
VQGTLGEVLKDRAEINPEETEKIVLETDLPEI